MNGCVVCGGAGWLPGYVGAHSFYKVVCPCCLLSLWKKQAETVVRAAALKRLGVTP